MVQRHRSSTANCSFIQGKSFDMDFFYICFTFLLISSQIQFPWPSFELRLDVPSSTVGLFIVSTHILTLPLNFLDQRKTLSIKVHNEYYT